MLNGLVQPGPVQRRGAGLEALVGAALADGQEQGRRQAEAIEIAHHDVALIVVQPLLQLGQAQALLLTGFIPDCKHARRLLTVRSPLFRKKRGRAIVRSDSAKWHLAIKAKTRRWAGFSEEWWREKDSNLRRQSRQIYSLIPLAAREPLHRGTTFFTGLTHTTQEDGGGRRIRTFEGRAVRFTV